MGDLADKIDRRLMRQPDWPAPAELMQSIHNRGHDITAITKHLVATTPLNEFPAQDLRYRLAAQLDFRADRHPVVTTEYATQAEDSPRGLGSGPRTNGVADTRAAPVNERQLSSPGITDGTTSIVGI